MQTMHVISMIAEQPLRVLQRMTTVFARHRVNVGQLNVFETKTQGVAHLNVVIYSNEILATKLVKQLSKIVELHEIHLRSTKAAQAA
ncbi:MAG: hypothetical protein Tsb005_00910 [Gammaproteobacteria bacterium]